jgi:short-subunit dehydrogenase involved in D-alanine esterification of teichoic acids
MYALQIRSSDTFVSKLNFTHVLYVWHTFMIMINNLLICAFSAITATCDALKGEGFECASYIVDITDKEKVYEAAKRVKEEIGKVDILINNAGIVTCRPLLDLPDKAIEATYNVNILSHYWVNISSTTLIIHLDE